MILRNSPRPKTELPERKPHRRAKRRTGFSLIELLVVIAVIGLLSAIVYTAVGRVRGMATRAKCVNNMRALATGFSLFLNDNGQRYPGNGPGGNVQNKKNSGSLRWHYRVGVYMDIPTRLISFTTGDNEEESILVRDFATHQEVFHCPVTPPSTYARGSKGNWLLGGYGVNKDIVRIDGDSYNIWGAHVSEIEDPSRTILLGERYAGGGSNAASDESRLGGMTLDYWGPYPSRITGLAANHDPGGDPASGHGTTHVLFCDGHVGQIELDSLTPWPGNLEF